MSQGLLLAALFLACCMCAASQQQKCSRPLCVELVLDGSGSITAGDWKLAKLFSSNFSSIMVSKTTSLGVVQFSSVAQQQVHLTQNITVILAGIAAMQQIGGQTAIGSGLLQANADLSARCGAGALNVVLLITDGTSNTGPDPVTAGQKMRAAGDIIVGVGVGNQVDFSALQQICSPNLVFSSSSWGNLTNLISQLASVACPSTTAPPSTAPPSTPPPTTVPPSTTLPPTSAPPGIDAWFSIETSQLVLIMSSSDGPTCRNALIQLATYCTLADNCYLPSQGYAVATNCAPIPGSLLTSLSNHVRIQIQYASDNVNVPSSGRPAPGGLFLRPDKYGSNTQAVQIVLRFTFSSDCAQSIQNLENASTCEFLLKCSDGNPQIVIWTQGDMPYDCIASVFAQPMFYNAIELSIGTNPPGSSRNVKMSS